MDISTIFGNRIKALRGNRSQAEVAKEIGTNAQTLGRYERGDRKPDIEIVQKIADYYNVSVDFLLGREPKFDKQELFVKMCELTGLSEEAIEWLREYGKRQILGSVLSELFTSEQFNDVICALFEISAPSNEFISALDDNGRAKENDGRAMELFRETDLKCFNAERAFRKVIDMFDARSKEVPFDYITGKPKSKPIY